MSHLPGVPKGGRPTSGASSGAVLVAARRHPAPPLAGGGELMTTPLLSPARVPMALQSLWAQRRLGALLDQATSAAALGKTAATSSCAVVAQDGRVIFSDGAGRAVAPASNMKLVTAWVLLNKLGPGYRFTTKVVATSRPQDGVLRGNLYFVGGGDPLLRLPSYVASLEDAGTVFTNVTQLPGLIKAAGVERVAGSVVGDDLRYDSLRTIPSWPPSYEAEGDVGPLSALGIDDGNATAQPLVPAGAPPALESAGVLTQLLDEAGVTVGGAPLLGAAPSGAYVVASLVSPPLSQVLKEVFWESDNTAMELMTKELGLKEYGSGSTAAGARAVRADLAEHGFPLTKFVNVDGSGLSHHDRVTCALLLSVLERSGPQSVLTQDLPVAGESGTLSEEMKGTIAEGRVEAKTGTLDGVKALSGWVMPVPGEAPGDPYLSAPVVFSLVLNGLPSSDADPAALTDRFAVDVAEYPQAPALALFEPS